MLIANRGRATVHGMGMDDHGKSVFERVLDIAKNTPFRQYLLKFSHQNQRKTTEKAKQKTPFSARSAGAIMRKTRKKSGAPNPVNY